MSVARLRLARFFFSYLLSSVGKPPGSPTPASPTHGPKDDP